MPISRRALAALTLAAPALPALARPALAQTAAPPPATGPDPRLAPRFVGQATAPVTVTEFFSLTCGHCATFHNTVWPEVKTKLVDTGRVRMVWRDFPLDGVALAAACVARALPADRYEPFIGVLFQNQNRWAFAEGRQMEELGKLAALAGMDSATFQRTVADEALRRGVFESRQQAVREHNVQATPSFLFNSRLQSGGVTFDRFQQLVQDAPRA
jgi:protein-disulfide isomerase